MPAVAMYLMRSVCCFGARVHSRVVDRHPADWAHVGEHFYERLLRVGAPKGNRACTGLGKIWGWLTTGVAGVDDGILDVLGEAAGLAESRAILRNHLSC